MSLRDRLANKQVRRLTVPIQVTDPAADQQVLNGALVAYQQSQARGDQAELDAATAAVQVAAEAVQAHYVDVTLQAMPSDDWEAAMARWSGDSIDWAQALAPLLAESCVDEELRDEEWWKSELAKDAWTAGDRDALRAALLRLNVTAVDPIVPKD